MSTAATTAPAIAPSAPSATYTAMKARLARGWNTWNVRSVTSHVLLPAGFALNLGVKEYRGGRCLKYPLIGRQGKEDEVVRPGPRSYDGAYTELTLTWNDIELTIQSATDGPDLLLLVTPVRGQLRPATLIVDAVMLWNRPGLLHREGNTLVAELPSGTVTAFATGASISDTWTESTGPYLALPLDQPVGLATGHARSVAEITAHLQAARQAQTARAASYGALAEVYTAIQTCIAWDTIYEASKDRVVTPVSRLWCCNSGGYILFCWDNYFAGYLAGIDARELAYANVIEITRELTSAGFVPNYANGFTSSYDRSQPPVGSAMVRELYRRYRDTWLIDELFADLLTWNRWWPAHRAHGDRLCWGSDPFTPTCGNYWETAGVNDRFGAALESGLDNSPMYDDIPFDQARHQLELADAGLTALYVMDCEALADLARVTGRTAEAAELLARAERFRGGLRTLWHEPTGIFLNQRTDTGDYSSRLSPTNFYPLIAGAATPAQAARMMQAHFYNPAEFYGEWIMPSCTRNDPAFPEQNYWRGRIWAPMNFLVYLGLRRYALPQARTDLATKSQALLLKEWREHGHVHENYDPTTGEGCNKGNSDRYYHWGALLGQIALIEAGVLAAPEAPL